MDPTRIESVDRALVLLQALATRGCLSVTDAATEIDVAVSTAHRILSTFVLRRFAVRGPNRLYYPGPELSWHSAAPSGARLIRILRPFLEKLGAQTRETIHLLTPLGADLKFIDGVESERHLRVGLRLGARMPGYCGAGGKAMFADLAWADVEALHPNGLPPWDTAKIRDMAGLKRELAATRQRGYGLNRDETEAGVTTLGISLRALNRRPLAAVTIAMPSVRHTGEREEALSKYLLAVKAESEQEIARQASQATSPDRGAG